ncbi:MAG: DUF4302 domain-containing protein [Bacteroidota bacterium]
MKKLSIYILAAAILVTTGCKKTYDDTVGGKTADERIAAAMAAYQTKLTKAPYGWIMTESTTGTAYNQGVSQTGPVATFSYFMEFTDSNKVTMFSDFDTSMAATSKTSDFRVKSLQRPALIFDTYSYIHVPCDPLPTVSKSPYGVGYGWGTDFEFSFADNIDPSQLGDTILLTGNLNSANAVLVKATKTQRDAYYAGQLKSTMLAWGNILNYFKLVSGAATPFELTPGLGGAKSIDINWIDAGNLKSAASSVYFTATSVNLVTPVKIGTQTISNFNNIVWDAGTATINTSINGSIAATITGSIAPLKNDLAAPYTWWKGSVNSGSYYYSYNGYHVNGVDDFYGVTRLVKWWYMLFWAKYRASGSTFYDANAGVVNGSLIGLATFSPNPPPATSATITTFTSDGRIIFKILGTFGSATSILNTTVRVQTLDASGYYLILKEDGKSYDMVVASDAKAWLTWSPWWNQ